jgi:hypothetical protein
MYIVGAFIEPEIDVKAGKSIRLRGGTAKASKEIFWALTKLGENTLEGRGFDVNGHIANKNGAGQTRVI